MKGKGMTITHFQVQNIIKAYRVQSAVRSRISRDKSVKKTVNPRDEVTLSTESKRRLLADKITQGVMQQFVRGSGPTEVLQQALQQLSQEYGQDLTLEAAGETGQGISFKAAASENPEEMQILSAKESQKLQNRLFDITKTMIYDNLI
jgi:hypothetical protein